MSVRSRESNVAGPSAMEWLAHKDHIVDLYREHTLKQVQTTMERKYSFRASKRMYDRKLKDWAVMKNMKKARKEEIVDLLVNTGTWASSASPSRKRHLSIDAREHAKVLRYAKAQRRGTPSVSPCQPERSFEHSRFSQRLNSGQLSRKQDTLSWNFVSLPPHSSSSSSGLSSLGSSGMNCQPTEPNEVDCTSSHSFSISNGSQEYSSLDAVSRGRRLLSSDSTCGNGAAPKLNYDFSLIPPSPQCSAKSLNVEKMLKALFIYFDGGMRPFCGPSILSGSASPASLLLRDTFWSELKNGIYLHKIQSPQLAIPALGRACDLAPRVLSKQFGFDLNFVKELFSSLSPVNTRVCPDIRRILLQYLSTLAHDRLTPTHPLAVICHELQHDNHDRNVSERALMYMIDAVEIFCTESGSDDISLDLEKTVVTLLRRDKDLETAARKAQVLRRKTLRRLSAHQTSDQLTKTSRELGQARMAATELAHIRMDQRGDHYDEAIALSIFVLTGKAYLANVSGTSWPPSPADLSETIEDKKSVYTFEDLAKIYDELQDRDRAIMWLERAKVLAEQLFGDASESTATAHIMEKLEQMRWDVCLDDLVMV